MESITFDQLPTAVSRLFEKLCRIERLLTQSNSNDKEEADQLLTVSQAADYLSLSVPTIYSLTSKGELPYMKRGKRNYYSKQELLGYLRQGRRKSNSELVESAYQYLYAKGK